jgi:hypothetical protein
MPIHNSYDAFTPALAAALLAIEGYTKKIDDLAVTGLPGTNNSLAYKVHEIEKHFHNAGQCYGNTGGNLARGVTTPFRTTAGAGVDTLGSELIIHDGTVIESGSTTKKFDFHMLYVVNVQTADVTHYLEFWYGTGTFAEAVAAGQKLGEVYYRAGSVNTDCAPEVIMTIRVTCNNKIWVRSSAGTASKWLDFLCEVHTYAA